jgi:hypothetical protein
VGGSNAKHRQHNSAELRRVTFLNHSPLDNNSRLLLKSERDRGLRSFHVQFGPNPGGFVNRQKRSSANSVVYVSKVGMLVVGLFMAAAFAQNPVPQIVGPVKPSAVAPGSGAFTLTVYGANFVPSAVVNWNYQPRSTTFISARELQAQVLASDVAKNTAGLISVTNPAPGGGNSSAAWAQVEVHAPISIFSLSKPETYGFGGWILLPADFNHDGILDLVGQFGYDLVLYDGKGNGAFQFGGIAGRFYPGAAGGAFGDFNNDGYLDVAFTSGIGISLSTSMTVMLGSSQGKFTVGSHVTAYKSGLFLVGDFNQDGKLDLIGDYGLGFSVFLGNGDGTFRHLSNTPGIFGSNMVAGDFNGDGRLDLAVMSLINNGSEYALYTFLGNGDGTFQSPLAVATFPESPSCSFQNTMVLSDFNGDGKPDIGFCVTGQIGIALGNGDGTFQPPVFLNVGAGTNQFTFSVGDINSDGKMDLLVSDFHDALNPQFETLLGNGDGTFQPRETISLQDAPGAELGFAVADINNDGLPDVMFPSTGPMLIFVQ